jgi:hypothetical protein
MGRSAGRRCAYCHREFVPSPYCPGQGVCSDPDCQRRRRREYHRKKLESDPEYRQICRDSRQKWRARNPDYQRRYRDAHREYSEENRRQQRSRDRRRRLDDLVKNNVALDLKSLAAEAWLIPFEAVDLVKNNLAFSELLIFQKVAPNQAEAA